MTPVITLGQACTLFSAFVIILPAEIMISS